MQIVKIFSLFGYLLFFGVTVYCVLAHYEFGHYAEFSAATTGGGVFGTVVQHYINSKYNSPAGQPPN